MPRRERDAILPRIFGPELPRFVERGWLASEEFLHRPGVGATFPELMELGAEPFEALVRRHRGPIGVQAVSDGKVVPRFPVTADQALAAFAEGSNVQMYQAEKSFPPVARVETALLSELGVGDVRPVSTIFASPAGTGLPRHFDEKDVWVFGLFGDKTFLLEPNREDPIPDWIEARGVTHDGMAPVPVGPGDCLFMPRGIWHATRASGGASFSLSIGIRRPTILDLLFRRLAAAVEPRAGRFVGTAADDANGDIARCLELLGKAIAPMAKKRPRRVRRSRTRRL